MAQDRHAASNRRARSSASAARTPERLLSDLSALCTGHEGDDSGRSTGQFCTHKLN